MMQGPLTHEDARRNARLIGYIIGRHGRTRQEAAEMGLDVMRECAADAALVGRFTEAHRAAWRAEGMRRESLRPKGNRTR